MLSQTASMSSSVIPASAAQPKARSPAVRGVPPSWTQKKTAPRSPGAGGWLVQEVPPKGQILLSYKGNMFSDDPPVFEVVLRAK